MKLVFELVMVIICSVQVQQEGALVSLHQRQDDTHSHTEGSQGWLRADQGGDKGLQGLIRRLLILEARVDLMQLEVN